MSNELVKYNTDHGEVVLSPEIIRHQLVPKDSKVTDQEVTMFLNLCKFQGLNPFIREAYLVKYGDSPATIVTGKEVFTKRAQKIDSFAGFQAGITFTKADGTVEQREGSLVLKGETLIGGWCRVYLKGYTVPYFDEVALEEYKGKKYDGTPTKMWAEKPATMIRKVAIVHALREAFPESLQGLYSQEEISSIDSSALPTAPVVVPTSSYGQITNNDDDPDYTKSDADYAEPAKQDLGNITMPFFKKYPNMTLREIAQQDIGYIEYFAKSSKDPATRDTLNAFLAQDKSKTEKVVADITPKAKATKSTPITDDGLIPPPAKSKVEDWSDIPLPFDI